MCPVGTPGLVRLKGKSNGKPKPFWGGGHPPKKNGQTQVAVREFVVLAVVNERNWLRRWLPARKVTGHNGRKDW